MILSVLGGSSEFEVKPSIRQIIKQGLEYLSSAEELWIITNGKNEGCAKIIGELMAANKGQSARSPIIVIGLFCYNLGTF